MEKTYLYNNQRQQSSYKHNVLSIDMRKYSEKEIKEFFKLLGLPTDNIPRPLFREVGEQPLPRYIISAGTSSKFVYSD
jgi:hypothetical protein